MENSEINISEFLVLKIESNSSLYREYRVSNKFLYKPLNAEIIQRECLLIPKMCLCALNHRGVPVSNPVSCCSWTLIWVSWTDFGHDLLLAFVWQCLAHWWNSHCPSSFLLAPRSCHGAQFCLHCGCLQLPSLSIPSLTANGRFSGDLGNF